jgi:hypothetical protein
MHTSSLASFNLSIIFWCKGDFKGLTILHVIICSYAKHAIWDSGVLFLVGSNLFTLQENMIF